MNIFNINGYDLDDTQISAIKSDAQNTLVVAGAGSGKSLTILGLINYLIKEKKYKENEILVISFTNEATLSLHNKILDLGYDKQNSLFSFSKILNRVDIYELKTIETDRIADMFFILGADEKIVKELPAEIKPL